MAEPSEPAIPDPRDPARRQLTSLEDPLPPVDLHGFDPTAYEWVPRPRRPRKDGWTAAKQRSFIETLADTGLVVEAARAVDMSPASCYRLRREPGGHGFAAAWEAAVQQASHRLVDVAFDRALNGVEDPVFDKDGRRIACRYRYNDRLLMFLLRAHQPDRYRHAHQSVRQLAEPPAPTVLPLPLALERLEPARPDAPHLAFDPERLAVEIDIHDQIAAIYADDADTPIAEPFLEPWQKPRERETSYPTFGEDFERRLAWLKRGETPPDDTSWPPPFKGAGDDDA